MKTKWLAGCILLAGAMILQTQTNDLSAALQKGLFEEEANRNLDAAISNYQSLAAQFDQDRQVAATAIFRLGECYRKLGQDNDAVVQYQRILREFPDQPTLATLSRQNLTALHAAVPPQLITAPQLPAPAGTFQQRLQRIITKVPQDSAAQTSAESAAKAAELEAEAAQLKAQVEHLLDLKREQRLVEVQQSYSNPVLTKLVQDLTDAEQKLAVLTNDYSPQDMHIVRATALVNAIKGQIDTQVEGVIKGLQAKMEVDLSAAKALRDQSGPVQAVHAEASPVTDSEDREIQRIQQLIQDSPDLINSATSGATPLFQAAGAGWFRVVTFLLDHGANINLKSGGQGAPLHGATENGNKAMVELLLSRGADVNATGGFGDGTALHIAAQNGFLAVAEVLLAHHADLNARNSPANGERTPLHRAAERGNVEMLKLLIARGADINAKSTDGSTPLGDAASAGQLDSIKALLAAKADPDNADNYGRAPMSHAAEGNNLEVVKTLLDAKADPNGGKLDAPLFCAIKGGNTNLVELLLRAGANPNLPGRLDGRITGYRPGLTSTFAPLELAIAQNHAEIVKLLLRFKADPNGNNFLGKPLIFDALPNTEILEVMLDAGADPNQAGADGEPPLMKLYSFSESSERNVAFARLLVVHGAKVNVQDKQGNTPLVVAVFRGDHELMKLLLANGADVNARRPSDGATALLLAVQSGKRELIELLLANKPDVNVWDKEDKAPLDYAKALGSKGTEIAALLRQHGALDNLPHWDRITVSRPSANYSQTVFQKGTNDWNQISLFDVLGVQYELINNSQSEPQRGNSVPYSYYAGNNSLSFPDLANIIIRRATADGKGWENRTIDLTSALNSGNCAADFQLRWGDVVEIPEKDHVLNERWPGLSTNELFTLKNCLTRHLQISVKGQITNIVITPQVKELVPGSREYPLSSYGAKMEPAVSLLKFEPFMLWPVLKDSELLLASSDLSHIKVKRRDITTGKMHEWMVDCSNPQAPPNLWLRDGDVIEVPEKP